MHKQKGFTFWSLTFTIGMIIVVSLLTMKLFPPYAEYFAVKKAINKLGSSGQLNQMSQPEIRRQYDNLTTVDSIEVVRPADLVISRSNSGDVVVTADYEVVIPLVANISALLTFHASTDNTLGKLSSE